MAIMNNQARHFEGLHSFKCIDLLKWQPNLSSDKLTHSCFDRWRKLCNLGEDLEVLL